MCSPAITKTQWNQNKVISERSNIIVSSVSSVQVCYVKSNIILVDQVISTVKKPNHSPWQNAEAFPSRCRRNMQSFLLSLWQYFLPTNCRGKLKNFEIALAFCCRRTSHLNFKGCITVEAATGGVLDLTSQISTSSPEKFKKTCKFMAVKLLMFSVVAGHVFLNLFLKICPLFGQILITCMKCSRVSFSSSCYNEKMHCRQVCVTFLNLIS